MSKAAKKPEPRKAVAKKRAAKKAAPAKTAAAPPPQNRQESGFRPLPPIETRFQPGVSGNPSGRPKSKPISDAIRKQLAKPVPGDIEGRTYADLIAQAAVVKAMKGDLKAIQEVADRIEGKSTQPISGEDGGPITMQLSGMTPQERDAKMAEVAERMGFRR